MIQPEKDQKHHHHDIVIVGGGLTGALCALALEPLGWSITILEHTVLEPLPRRLIMLTPAAWDCVLSLGISVPAREVSRMEISAARWTGDGFYPMGIGQKFHLGENLPHVGFCVEMRTLLEAVYQRIKQKTILYEKHCHVRSLLRDEESGRVIGVAGLRKEGQKKGTSFRRNASLVIASDGGQSLVRTLSQTSMLKKPCGHALTLFFKNNTHNTVARQVFLPSETIAFLPGLRDEKMLVWSLSTQKAAMMQDYSPSLLLQEAVRRFGQTGQDFKPLGNIASFPLLSVLTHALRLAGLCFIGDAAHVVHPLLGMGASLGMRDVQWLYQSLRQARDLGLEPGNRTILNTYQRKCFAHNALVFAGGYGLYKLFEPSNFPTTLAGLGLSLCDRSPWFKKMLWETFCSSRHLAV